ncbi:MAG: glycosyltransferase family 39 protein, partial [Acidobacteriales bacterium]|nr:glycosyltransferase family 39 protein [Terriglobales bacterium]
MLRPGNNEAWFAQPALELIHNGTFGTPVIDGKGTWLAGIEQHTYWIMPLYPLIEAPWFKVVGFSLLRQRALTIVFGAILLACLMLLVRRLIGSRAAALLAGALLACDAAYLRF